MSVLYVQTSVSGLVPNVEGAGLGQTQQMPVQIYISTNDTLATVTTAGYLNKSAQDFHVNYNNYQMALVYCSDVGPTWLKVTATRSGTITTYSLVVPSEGSGSFTSITLGNGTAAAPSLNFTSDTTTGLYRSASHAMGFAANGVAAGTFSATALTWLGNLVAGSTAAAGTVTSFPGTANGQLIWKAIDAGSAHNTTVSNASSVGQNQVITIPDSGAATANFLLDTGTANTLTDFQQFVGLSDVLSFGTGTWTTTRAAEGNYFKEHSAAAETSIIGVDITPYIRTTSSKGFKLVSFDFIYGIGTAAVIAHTVTLDKINYANNAAVTVTSVPITGTLATATQANPYVTNVTVNTPAFDNTTDSKYVIEVTVQNDTTTVYDFYGIVLKFDQTIA